ncbi:MAG: hypothetical protein B7Y97_13425 [Sphingomonas sp. 32-66-10]|nr:MAG: hypothetical protein B7Y97_13425 [Sphingomonas sp. 32-66-10]
MLQALLLTTAIAGAGLASGAQAQSAEPATTSGASGVGLQEVVVTARRRSENLQVTPVAVTAMSANVVSQLNLRQFQDLRGVVPNLEVLPQAGGGANLTIRGVGQASAQANVDTKTGFYVDEVYIARQEGNTLSFYDIDSVQVLKGPQGTLFGKNTTAGAFLLSTARPTADPGGYVVVRAGNYKRIDTEGAVNLPLTDTVLTRFSFRTNNTDGYIKHLLDDGRSKNINDKSGRVQVRWFTTPKLTTDFLAEYNQSNTNGEQSITRGCLSTASYVRNYDSLHSVPFCTAYPLLGEPYLVYGGATLSVPTSSIVTDIARGGDALSSGITRNGSHRSPFNDTYVGTLNLRLNYQLTDDITLKSISAYRRSVARFFNATVNVPNDIYGEIDDTETKQWSQEFNLNGRGFGGRLNYVLGLYYSSQKTDFLQDTGPDWIDPVGYRFYAYNDFQSYAAYAQASFKILEPLELTLGGRYSSDKKSAVSDVLLQTVFTPPCNGFVNAFKSGEALCAGHLTGADSDSWHSFDPRAQLSYRINPDLFVYGSITRGYNAGGFNQQLGSTVPGNKLISYAPEKLTSYEIGMKSEWWDKRVRFNIDFFYQKYADIQSTLTVIINGVNTRQVQTGATAHEQGAEAELEFMPTPDLVIRANAAWLDQAYDTIVPSAVSANFNLGLPLNSAPKFTYAIGGEYTFHLFSDATLAASLDWRAVGKKPNCTPVGSCYTPAYGMLGGRLNYRPSSDSDWTVSLWGTNLLDEYVQLNATSSSASGVYAVNPGRPREYGFEIRRTF